MVISSPADIDVLDGLSFSGLIRQWFLIQIVLKDGRHAAIAGAADSDGTMTGSLEPIVPIAFGQSQDAQAASKALLGMSTGAEDIFNQAFGVRTDFSRPADKPLRCPLDPFLM